MPAKPAPPPKAESDVEKCPFCGRPLHNGPCRVF